MKQTYRGERLELKDMVRPRRDLLSDKYMWGTIETSRGCPIPCEFCAVPLINGHPLRQRPVEEVLDELETIPQRYLFFLDNNLVHRGKHCEERAIELFEGMVRRGIKKKWFCQTSMNFADDEEVIKAAARAGCIVAEIGAEAEDVEALTEIGKKPNLGIGVEAYEEAFRRIHRHGIAISGTFIFGVDSDTPGKLRRRTEYMTAGGVNLALAFVQTPLPGTPLMRRLEKEGRLLYTDFPSDWDRYDFLHVTCQPAMMSPEELSGAWMDAMRRLYSPAPIARRLSRSLRDSRDIKTAAYGPVMNLTAILKGLTNEQTRTQMKEMALDKMRARMPSLRLAS